MKRLLSKVVTPATRLLVLMIVAFQLVACGTILYPERRGQTHGQIDPAIAILDGLGLLLFIIPGVIAFGVDFATGAIYLPSGGKKKKIKINKKKFSRTDAGMTAVHVGMDRLTLDDIAEIINGHTGIQVDLASPVLRIYDIKDGDLAALEAALEAEVPNSHMVMPVNMAALAGLNR